MTKTEELVSFEQTVGEIWSEILKKDGIGIHDDFFDLGGTSQQLIHVVGKMGERFSLPLDTNIVLEGVTIASLAKSVQRRAAGDGQIAATIN